MRTSPMNMREHDTLLTGFLIKFVLSNILALIGALSLPAVYEQLESRGIDIDLPSWYLPTIGISVVIALIAAYGTWKWKRWGLYLLAADLVALIVILGAGYGLALSILPLALAVFALWYIFRNKRFTFEG